MKLLLAALIAIAAILLFSGRMPRRVLAGLGIAFVLGGAGALAGLELWYAPPRAELLNMALPLDRAGAMTSQPFVPALSDPYDISLQLDRGDGVLSFGCLTGEDGFEALCLGHPQPELDLEWTLTEAGTPIARGGSDLDRWRTKVRGVDPKAAAVKLAKYRAYADHAQEPSDQTPLYHSLGAFHAIAGHSYRIVFGIRSAAPSLAKLHPRIVVGLSADLTRSIGQMYLGIALLCIGGGAFMLLLSLPRAKQAP